MVTTILIIIKCDRKCSTSFLPNAIVKQSICLGAEVLQCCNMHLGHTGRVVIGPVVLEVQLLTLLLVHRTCHSPDSCIYQWPQLWFGSVLVL